MNHQRRRKFHEPWRWIIYQKRNELIDKCRRTLSETSKRVYPTTLEYLVENVDDTPQCVSCNSHIHPLASFRCKQFFCMLFIRHQKVHHIIVKSGFFFLPIRNIFIRKCWCRRNSIWHYFITTREKRKRGCRHFARIFYKTPLIIYEEKLSWKSKFIFQKSTQFSFIRSAIRNALTDGKKTSQLTIGRGKLRSKR